jgi:hypothetical protein
LFFVSCQLLFCCKVFAIVSVTRSQDWLLGPRPGKCSVGQLKIVVLASYDDIIYHPFMRMKMVAAGERVSSERHSFTCMTTALDVAAGQVIIYEPGI